MFNNPIRAVARTFVAGALMLGTAAATPAVFADDDDDRFGTYIYAGTVDDLDNARVVEDIDDLEDDDDRDEHWSVLGNGQDMPDELYSEDEDLDDDIDLDTLTGEPHMIVVHETESRDSAVVAVGMIEGEIVDGTLLIQLDEHEDSGWEGRAWFGPEDDDDDDDDDDLEVVVGVFPTGSVDPLGTPDSIG